MSTYPINEGEQNQAGESYTCELFAVNEVTNADITFNSGVIERSYGGPLSTFGQSWTRDNLSEGDFGVSLNFTAGSSDTTVDASDIEVKVYYNLPASITETVEGDTRTTGLFSVATNRTNDTKIAVGKDGTMYRSTDLGTTWNIVEHGFVGTDLLKVKYRSGKFIISGARGLILQSTDDGVTWSKIGSNVRNSIYDFNFRSAVLGWIFVGAEDLDIISPPGLDSYRFRYNSEVIT